MMIVWLTWSSFMDWQIWISMKTGAWGDSKEAESFLWPCRKLHTQRRPLVSSQDAAAFVERMSLALRRLFRWRIINRDETLWKMIENHTDTVSTCGIIGVNTFFFGNPKICQTAIASISATGDRLAMWVIAKGRTDSCERPFHSDSEAIKRPTDLDTWQRQAGRLRKSHADICNSTVARYLEKFCSCGTCLQHIKVWPFSQKHEPSEFA
jgi:hypothetical protein